MAADMEVLSGLSDSILWVADLYLRVIATFEHAKVLAEYISFTGTELAT